MTLAQKLLAQMRLPIIAAPMFIVSQPDLVLAQCTNGVIGSFPALNARGEGVLETWLQKIIAGCEAARTTNNTQKSSIPIAPFAINQIVHSSNTRLQEDMTLCVKYRVPIVITSLGLSRAVIDAVHSYGGIVLHDVINVHHAQKAVAEGVDGLILVCAGAGGHGGTYNPIGFVNEVRQFFTGPLALAGTISTGADVLSAQAMGADFAYMGTRFIATTEAHATPEYKNCIVQSNAADILYTPYFTSIPGNYLKPSIVALGLDPMNLPQPEAVKIGEKLALNNSSAKAWRDVWGAGQGVGTIDTVLSTPDLIDSLEAQYRAAKVRIRQL